MSDDEMKDMVDEVVEDSAIEVEQEKRPHPTDPEWVDYVLDQLADHELINGAPTTDGLRRVTEKVFGEILSSETDILEVPKSTVNGKATAKHTLTILKYETGHTITVSACVDVLGEKLPYPFNQHIVSTACTRSEGKALRRALKIRVQTAEELANTEEEITDTEEKINDQQIVAINVMCKRNNVNLVSLVKEQCDNPKSIKEISSLDGRLLINKLSKYQREGVPEKLVGYRENWKDTFGGKA